MKPTLLVTNIKSEMIAKTPNVPRLVTYLNTVNGKNDFNNTIWYAIFPNVAFNARVQTKLTRQRFKGNVAKEEMDVNTIETLTRILDVLKDFRVQCFFSFSSNEKNTFNAMDTKMTLSEDNLAEVSKAKLIFRRNVDSSLPGVRFDIEEDNNSLQVAQSSLRRKQRLQRFQAR